MFQGFVPMYVNATAGTTVYGAFDPINEIADICEKYNMWLHVDVSAAVQRTSSRNLSDSPLACLNFFPRRVRGEGVCSCPGSTDTS